MLTAKLQLDTRRRTKRGYPYKIYLSGYGKKKYISIGLYAEKEPGPRDNEYRLIRRRESEILEQLDFCNFHKFKFEEAARYLERNADPETEIAMLRKRLLQLEHNSQAMLFEFWDVFTTEVVTAGKSPRAYDRTRPQIGNYTLGDIPINDIDYEWILAFSQFKYKGGCGPAGLSYYLRTLRTVYLEAQRRPSLAIKPGNPFVGLIPSSKPKPPVQLSREELEKIKTYQPRTGTTRANIKRVRRRVDLWLLQFYIGGHDYADIANLKWTDIRKGRIRFERFKNRNRGGGVLIDNILLPEAKAIIEKYGTKGKERVFSFLPEPVRIFAYDNYRKNTNRALREMSNDLQLSSVMKTKSPRYIFRSWAGEMQMDVLGIMQLQGHKARGMTFSYQGRLSNSVVDPIIQGVVNQTLKL